MKNYSASVKIIIAFLLFGLIQGIKSPVIAAPLDQQTRWQAPARIPVPEGGNSWYPDVAVDMNGIVHTVWTFTTQSDFASFPESGVEYARWDGSQWSQYNDIQPPTLTTLINTLVADQGNLLHLLFVGPPDHTLYYSQVDQSQAFSAVQWSLPVSLNNFSYTTSGEMAIDHDSIHIVYDDRGGESQECSGCGDIYYRYSNNRGVTWSSPTSLYATNIGSSYPQIKADTNGNVYVVWEEGSDVLSRSGTPQYGIFMFWNKEQDQWSDPKAIQYPGSNNTQFSVGVDNQGGVMLVWRTTAPEYNGIYYLWSTDYGKTWSLPQALPGITSSQVIDIHDTYDMATDSAGIIHILVAGSLQTNPSRTANEEEATPVPEQSVGLYHFEWDGNRWSSPDPVFRGDRLPVYPQLTIQNGNQLKAVWYTIQNQVFNRQNSEVFFAQGQSQAPFQETTPLPTLTPKPTRTTDPNSIANQNSTPTATLSPNIIQVGDQLYTEVDEYLTILASLVPVSLIIIVAVLVLRMKKR